MRASRKPFRQGRHRFDLLVAAQHAPLQLEIVESVTGMGRFGQPDDCLRWSAPPRCAGGASRPFRRRLPDREGPSCAGHRCRTDIPGPPPRNAAGLPPEGRRRALRGTAPAGRAMRLPRPSRAWIVVRRSKVCRPRPPASLSPKEGADGVQDGVVGADRTGRGPAVWRLRAFWRIRSPPGTSPTPVCPALSFRITTLRVKEREMRAAEVEQHAVAAGNRYDLHVGDDGCPGGMPPACLMIQVSFPFRDP